MTPKTGPPVGPDGHPLADQRLRIPAADRLDVEKPVVVDVRTIRPIWSQWPASMTRSGAPGLLATMTLPCRSVVDVVGEIGHVLADDFLHRAFVAGGAGRFEDALEEFQGLRFHFDPSLPFLSELR